jgi:di/tricarboxylate transporter
VFEKYVDSWLKDIIFIPERFARDAVKKVLHVCTTITWLIIMFLTPKDEAKHLENCRVRISAKNEKIRRAVWALVVGLGILIVYLLLMVFIIARFQYLQ